MKFRYLIDANVLSDLIRNPQGSIRDRIDRLGETEVGTSIIVAAELRYGVAKKRSPRLRDQVEAVLAPMQVAPFGPPADRIYGDLRVLLELAGRPLAANDLLIAAHALTLDCVLVTDDRGFEHVPGLTVVNWLR